MMTFFLVSPTKATISQSESGMFIQGKLKQVVALDMDLELESESLCTLKAK